jgi:hypothetical protein
MKFKQILTAAAAASTLLIAGASGAAADYYHDRDRDGRPDNSWAERHDRDGYRDNYRYDRRMDRRDYRHYRHIVDRYRVFDVVRAHHLRYIGEPYWNRGVYGVRAYGRYGQIVFVRVDPYTGDWIGISGRI